MTGRPRVPKYALQSWVHGAEESAWAAAHAAVPCFGITEVPWYVPCTSRNASDMFVKDMVPLSYVVIPATKSSCSFEERVMLPWTGLASRVPLTVPLTDVPVQSKVALS